MPNTEIVVSAVPESTSLVGRHVIVSRAYGHVEVHDATVEKAMELLEGYRSHVPAEVIQFLETDHTKVRSISADLIVGILTDAGGNLSIGEPFPRLRRLLYGVSKKGAIDVRPEVHVTQEMADTVMLWAARKGILVGSLSTYAVKKYEAHKHLHFLGLHLDDSVRIIDGDWVFDMARDWKTIQESRWKDTATEHGKASFILRFIKDNLGSRHIDALDVVKIT